MIPISEPRTVRLSAGECVELWRGGISHFDDKDFVTLYISIPYCIEHCSFCLYYRLPYAGKTALDGYLDELELEAELYAPVFAGRKIAAIYVGGGTPSLLDPSQISRLFQIVRDSFDIELGDHSFRCFEAHPGYFTPAKIEAALQDGFINRISFGVQSTDTSVVQANNRNQVSPQVVERLVQLARRQDPHRKLNINVDLMIGLDGDTYDAFLRSFRQISHLDVDRISVYSNRLKEQADGARFKAQSIEWLGRLAEDICREEIDFVLLNDSTSFYQESVAWGRSNYAANKLFKWSYNSSPVDYNNNVGLGLGASSHIIATGVMYWNSGRGVYKMRHDPAAVARIARASQVRRERGWRINTYNF